MKKVLDEDGKELGIYDGKFIIIKEKKAYRVDEDGDVFSSAIGYIANSGSDIVERVVGRILEGECKTEFGQILFKIV